VLSAAVALVIGVGVVDLATPPELMVFGLTVAGPVLAVASARPWAVAAIAAFALLTAWVVSTLQGLGGTLDQTFRLFVNTGLSVICVATAQFLRVMERRALRAAENESTLAGIVHGSADAIITTDLDGKIITWNDAATRQYGWTADEMIGKNVSMLIVPERRANLAPVLRGLAEGRDIVAAETQRVRKDGSVIDISVSVAPVRDRQGRVVAAAGIERDVTAQRQAEERRRQMLERSARAERLESLGQLAGGIAHDFNNLLAINLNYLDFALEQTNDEDVREDLRRARVSAERARDLIRQLLVFARKEPGSVELVDLNTVIEDTRILLDRTIGAHIELVTRPAAAPPTVRADRSRLEQILCNLVINSRDAMPDGGVIVIEATIVQLADDPTRQPPLPAGPYVEIQVSDTGVGMPPEVAARIFEPFFTTKAKQHGTGPGLATVYGVVTEAGGGIAVSSEPGVGTTFRILLPFAAADAAAATAADSEPPHGDGRHVLLVEDDGELQQIVVRILEGHGYRVTAAGHGRTALELLGRDEYDLLLSDVIMPEMSGVELAEAVRRRHPSVPVLLISGYPTPPAGVMPIIYKPFTADELLRRVAENLPKLAEISEDSEPMTRGATNQLHTGRR
jgi:PAS domain S-box-containing protein